MRLLHVEGPPAISVLLFGVGLIGGAVDRALRQRWAPSVCNLPYDWHDALLRAAQTRQILSSLPPSGRIEIVWTGGGGGFGADENDMQRETAIVEELIALAESLRDRAEVAFHLTSSAGGLFEGQTHCGADTPPAPLRPYGQAKLAQERRLQNSRVARHHIYRPSSVYGVTRSKRVGLVTMLILNAMAGRVTNIFGSPHTLRDYVMADDIGRYIAGNLARAEIPPSGIHCLANGRSASIGEIIGRVREQVAHPVYLQFDSRPSNALDMSFLSSGLPAGWRPTPLGTGISLVAHRLRTQFFL